MDSLEAVQKSHQERLDAVTRHANAAGADASRGWTRVFDLEKQVKDLQERNDWQAKEVEAGWKFRDQLGNSKLELSESQRRIADLEKQLADKTRHADNGWARAHEVSVMVDAADNKLDAIKKFLDSRRADGFTSFVMQTIENILGGN